MAELHHVTVEDEFAGPSSGRSGRPLNVSGSVQCLVDPGGTPNAKRIEDERDTFRLLERPDVGNVTMKVWGTGASGVTHSSDDGPAPHPVTCVHRQTALLQVGVVDEHMRGDLQHHDGASLRVESEEIDRMDGLSSKHPAEGPMGLVSHPPSGLYRACQR